MSKIIESLLENYKLNGIEDFEQAMREVIQEIALLGMWRGKFFEKGAFYGGTALRIIYGLNRFSEDLDFTLLEKDSEFDISIYESVLLRELKSFDLDVKVEKKEKSKESNIESAFIKANTMIHIIKIHKAFKTNPDKIIKIKLEVDTSPFTDFKVEEKSLLKPIPFAVRTLDLPSLFAGKIAAMLFRPYQFNVKGRDWYDFLWYTARNTPFNLKYFSSIAVGLKKWPKDKKIKLSDIQQLLVDRINEVDISLVKKDVSAFLSDPGVIEGWNKEIFLSAVQLLRGSER